MVCDIGLSERPQMTTPFLDAIAIRREFCIQQQPSLGCVCSIKQLKLITGGMKKTPAHHRGLFVTLIL
jgi:hypothetical protein